MHVSERVDGAPTMTEDDGKRDSNVPLKLNMFAPLCWMMSLSSVEWWLRVLRRGGFVDVVSRTRRSLGLGSAPSSPVRYSLLLFASYPRPDLNRDPGAVQFLNASTCLL
jgi:hypothetical protein